MIIAAWVTLSLSVLGFVLLWLSKIPVITDRVVGRSKVLMLTDSFLGYLWGKVKLLLGKLWHFILEAKDLRPPLPINKLMHIGQMTLPASKKAFRIRIRQSEAEPAWMPEAAELNDANLKNTDMENRYLGAIKHNPHDLAAYEGLARLYLQEKNYTEAAETFDYLTKLEPNKDVYWSNLGLSLFSIRQFRRACEAYQRALDLNNKIPVRWINLALCLDNLDETVKSIKAITQAIQLDSRNINYQFLLADMYMKLGNKVRAEEVLQQILQVDPTNKPAREKLMKIRI
ncbi:MAG: tetratricopeptide repeat protein [Candidatus Doudnabacteria bacterium]|nr:tetratricopeptide repeat protein [Candidatus Doudnabacteria bacterium]